MVSKSNYWDYSKLKHTNAGQMAQEMFCYLNSSMPLAYVYCIKYSLYIAYYKWSSNGIHLTKINMCFTVHSTCIGGVQSLPTKPILANIGTATNSTHQFTLLTDVNEYHISYNSMWNSYIAKQSFLNIAVCIYVSPVKCNI